MMTQTLSPRPRELVRSAAYRHSVDTTTNAVVGCAGCMGFVYCVAVVVTLAFLIHFLATR